MLKKDAIVLFQGDSITDCGRDREDNSAMGNGYAMMSAAWYQALHPERNTTFLNRGISGNRVEDLMKRWEQDCLDLKPDVVSILIGINDTWRRYDSNDPTSAETYYQNYRVILSQVKDVLDAHIIVCEPFLLPVTDAQKKLWREDLDPKIQAARELSRDFHATYIPFDGIFAAACAVQTPEFWAADGVHPTPAGHALMAKHWLEAIHTL